jgi:integral membrane sensor domain MASE1
MAAAGASLGFSVQKLDGQVPGQPLYIGLSAMALWILSFAMGCMVVMGTQRLVSINQDLIVRLERKQWTKANVLDARSRREFARVGRHHFYQFAFLAIGVVLFAAWRVLLIFQPPYHSPCVP